MRSHSFLLAIFSVVCKLLVAVEQPTITLKEGLPAEIPCMVKGVADAYFWRRGEHLNISDEIATIVFGVPGVVSDALRVTEDGTLMIYNVTSAIEGRYFCRISTKDNAYFSDVMVLVQVLFEDFGFGIEQCYPKESCTLQVEPYTTTNVTCTATGVPSSFSLKWYNGSEVITSVSSEHSSNKVSTTISETITISSDFGLPLTCKAIDMENGQTCGRFAHVRLNKTDKATQHTDAADKSSARWVIPLVLLIVVSGFTILLLIFTYVRIKKDKKNINSPSNSAEEDVGLMSGNTYVEPKDDEIAELKNKLKQKQEELTDLEANFKQKQKELTDLQVNFKSKYNEIAKLKMKFEQKQMELTDLQDNLKLQDDKLKVLMNKLESKDDKLAELKNELDGGGDKETK